MQANGTGVSVLVWNTEYPYKRRVAENWAKN